MGEIELSRMLSDLSSRCNLSNDESMESAGELDLEDELGEFGGDSSSLLVHESGPGDNCGESVGFSASSSLTESLAHKSASIFGIRVKIRLARARCAG